jgi:hypothetical protein
MRIFGYRCRWGDLDSSSASSCVAGWLAYNRPAIIVLIHSKPTRQSCLLGCRRPFMPDAHRWHATAHVSRWPPCWSPCVTLLYTTPTACALVGTGGRHRSEQPAGTVTQSHSPERHHTGCSVTDRGVDHPPVELGQLRRSLPTTFHETAERTPEHHIQCRHKAPQMTWASVLAVPCRTLSALVGTLVPALRRGPGASPDASHRLQGP